MCNEEGRFLAIIFLIIYKLMSLLHQPAANRTPLHLTRAEASQYQNYRFIHMRLYALSRLISSPLSYLLRLWPPPTFPCFS